MVDPQDKIKAQSEEAKSSSSYDEEPHLSNAPSPEEGDVCCQDKIKVEYLCDSLKISLEKLGLAQE